MIVGEPGWDGAARAPGAAKVVHGASNEELAVLAASRSSWAVPSIRAAADLSVPGRLEQMGEAPLEIWDGAHNPAGVEYLLAHLPARDWVVVASILADKDADGMLAALARLGGSFVATSSGHDRGARRGRARRPRRAVLRRGRDGRRSRRRGRARPGRSRAPTGPSSSPAR